MKFAVLVLLSTLTNLSIASQVPDYKAEQISKNTYVIHGPLEFPNAKNKGFMNNPAFVITSDSVVVIDPGSSLQVGEMLIRQIKKITNKPVSHVLNTHVHGDHWLGNHAFEKHYKNVAIMAHPHMIKEARDGQADYWVSYMEKLTEGASKGTKAVIPQIEVNHSFEFKAGNTTFRIYAPKEAHSGSDMMIEVVEESVVFLGDNVLAERLPRLDDATFRGSMNACDVAIKIAARHYVPGHGISGDINVVKNYSNYLNIVYNEAAKHMDEGLSDFEMKPMILKKVKNYQNWSGFDSQFGKHISLAVLEAEQAAFE